MSKFVNSVILGLVVFVIILSAVWYVDDARREPQLQVAVQDVQSEWGTADGRVTEIRTAITFQNPHKIQIQLVEVAYEVEVDGKTLENGTRYQTRNLPAEANETIQYTARFATDFVAEWFESYAAQEEMSELVIRGRAKFLIGQQQMQVPFAMESSWHSSLLASVADGLDNCPADAETLCLASALPQFVPTSGGDLGIQLTMEFLNPNASVMKIRDFQMALLFEGLPVSQAQSPREIRVEPASTQSIEVLLELDAARLEAWWPRHVAQCERSATQVDIGFIVEEQPVPADESDVRPSSVSLIEWNLAGQTFETRFLCNQK